MDPVFEQYSIFDVHTEMKYRSLYPTFTELPQPGNHSNLV